MLADTIRKISEVYELEIVLDPYHENRCTCQLDVGKLLTENNCQEVFTLHISGDETELRVLMLLTQVPVPVSPFVMESILRVEELTGNRLTVDFRNGNLYLLLTDTPSDANLDLEIEAENWEWVIGEILEMVGENTYLPAIRFAAQHNAVFPELVHRGNFTVDCVTSPDNPHSCMAYTVHLP